MCTYYIQVTRKVKYEGFLVFKRWFIDAWRTNLREVKFSMRNAFNVCRWCQYTSTLDSVETE